MDAITIPNIYNLIIANVFDTPSNRESLDCNQDLDILTDIASELGSAIGVIESEKMYIELAKARMNDNNITAITITDPTGKPYLTIDRVMYITNISVKDNTMECTFEEYALYNYGGPNTILLSSVTCRRGLTREVEEKDIRQLAKLSANEFLQYLPIDEH